MDRWEYKQITLSTSANGNAKNEEKLNELGGANGIGLLDIVENRLVGM